MSDQHPPAWNPDHHPTGPYGAPPPPPQPYGAPPQHTARLPQYAPPQYAPPPQYGSPPPQYGGQPPAKRPKGPWLLVGAAVVVVALIGGAVVLLTGRGDDTADAGAPIPTATFTDGVVTPTAGPSTEPPSATPSTTPSASPTPKPPAERRRTLKDIDQGVLVYDDVYVKPASGWTRISREKSSVLLGNADRTGVLFAAVAPVGYSPAEAASSVAKGLITGSRMAGVQQKPAKTLSPMNSNISAQAEVSFSGRIRTNGVSVSLVGRCTSMTGVESIHNVTVTVCVEARRDVQKSVFRAADRMLTSVARSI